MSSFVKSVTVSHDIDTSLDVIDIEYVRYKAGVGYEHVREHFNTKPIGDWKHIKVVYETLRYEQFLDTMILKTTEVRRKMALVELESVMCENNNTRSIVRAMNAVKILDPTFSPPVINMHCTWQKKFAKDVCEQHMPQIIKTCTNDMRLEKFFRVLQLIEVESLHPPYYS